MFANRDFNHPFNWDTDWNKKYELVKKDPYRYILSDKEVSKCEAHFKRALFYLGIPMLYAYKNFRYHNELSRVKKLNFSSIQLLQIIPKTGLWVVVLYLASIPLFVDYDKKKLHLIAKYELQKFDPEYFTYDDFKYAFHNAPFYQTEDSVWGRLYPSRLPYNYYQTAGWIRRIREQNPDIMDEVPPKYHFTPKPPRSMEKLKEIENKPLPFQIKSTAV